MLKKPAGTEACKAERGMGVSLFRAKISSLCSFWEGSWDSLIFLATKTQQGDVILGLVFLCDLPLHQDVLLHLASMLWLVLFVYDLTVAHLH